MKIFAADIVRQVAREHGLSVDDIRGKRKLPKLVAARIEIIQRLHALEFGMSRIGRAINRNHATVQHHIDPKYKARNMERVRRYVAARTAAKQQQQVSA